MQNSTVVRTRSRNVAASRDRGLSWSFMLLVVICAFVVAAGFFFAARQHFTSMEYGLKNSKLREQLQNLETEKRRLLLAREVALSPVSIRKAARGVGLHEATDVAAIPVVNKPSEDKATDSIKAIKTDNAKASATQPVVKTVLTAPVQSKPAGETRTRVVDTTKEKKEKTEVAVLLGLK